MSEVILNNHFTPDRGVKYCDQNVCSHAYLKNLRPNIKFSVHCTSGFVYDSFSHNGPVR